MRWLLDSLKICSPLLCTILKIVGTGKHHSGYSLQVLYAGSLQMYKHLHKPIKPLSLSTHVWTAVVVLCGTSCNYPSPTIVLFFRAVKSMEGAEENLANIHELLKNAVFLRQQIKYEEARRHVSYIL